MDSAAELFSAVEAALNDREIAAYEDFTDAVREVLALARQAEALQRENAEKDAEISKLLDFVGKAQGVAMGVAMSGRAHPNPDGALMGIFNDGQELIEAIRARALLGGENAE